MIEHNIAKYLVSSTNNRPTYEACSGAHNKVQEDQTPGLRVETSVECAAEVKTSFDKEVENSSSSNRS